MQVRACACARMHAVPCVLLLLLLRTPPPQAGHQGLGTHLLKVVKLTLATSPSTLHETVGSSSTGGREREQGLGCVCAALCCAACCLRGAAVPVMVKRPASGAAGAAGAAAAAAAAPAPAGAGADAII